MGDAAFHLPQGPYEVVSSSDARGSWLKSRRSGIGASEIAGVLGIDFDSRNSPLSIYMRKVGRLPELDLSDVEHVQWGNILEPVIAEQFSKRTGRPIRKGGDLLRSTEYPWALATLDYWTTDGSGEWWPLEVKNVTAFKSEDWENGVPEYFEAQVQQQMLVTGARRATSACLLGGNRLAWCDVPRDETFIRRIVHHGSNFWDRVVRRDPPDPDGSEATRRTLHDLFPVEQDRSVVLPADLEQIVFEWQELKAKAKETETAIQLRENQIKATLGDAKLGYLPCGDYISWKSQSVRERTMPATTFRVLRYHPKKG